MGSVLAALRLFMFRYRIEIRQPRADGEEKQLITVGWHEAMRGCI